MPPSPLARRRALVCWSAIAPGSGGRSLAQIMGNCRSHITPTALEAIDLGQGIRIETPVILAPMSGVTDLPFRRTAKQLGAGMVVSEMIASWAMIRGKQKTLR